MDGEKPFKTLEVIDSRTKQVCKVACMSCIRGHRTTSCGIPVCRTKVFWTVKRPGRPSNSCTCRYGATGGCKCVVARAACPHKSKKGEKRSGECRCDEYGRYCCLLEPEHWTVLLSLNRPVVDFFRTREALEEVQATTSQTTGLHPPARQSTLSPTFSASLPDPSTSLAPMPPMNEYQSTNGGSFSPTSSTLTPRFGMMGIGAPMGQQDIISPDVLVWEGHAPLAPRSFDPIFAGDRDEGDSCCQTLVSSNPPFRPPAPVPEQSYGYHVSASNPPNSMVPMVPTPFDFEKLRTEYMHHQFPNSICQNCGLSGCTCRNCPPIFQNFGTTSWAQCCGRKHARDVQAPPPVPQKIARTQSYNPTEGLHAQGTRHQPLVDGEYAEQNPILPSGSRFHHELDGMSPPSQSELNGFHDLNIPTVFDHDPGIPPGTDPLDLNAFLMSDLDRSQDEPTNAIEDEAENTNGCCCR